MATHFPEDLLIRILARLPVKSLLRFKSVCKHWYNLIQSPNFLDNHSHIHNHTHLLVLHKTRDINTDYYEENGFDYDPFSISGWNSGITDEQFALLGFPDETLECQPPLSNHIIDFIQVFPYKHDIIGPVNGVFLLKYFRDDALRVSLWNPATTEFRLISLPSFIFPPDFCSSPFGCSDFGYGCSHVFGFGLDVFTNNYKVIWIPIVSPMPSDYPKAAIQTLTTRSWRPIESEAFDVLPRMLHLWGRIAFSCPIYLGGVNYWLLQHEYEYWIVLFDLSGEVFREINIPDRESSTGVDQKMCSNCDFNLVSHNDDSIALLVTEYVSASNLVMKSIEIWVMKHEEEGHWIKHFTLRLGALLRLRKPLGFWKGNHMIFFETCNDQLVLYNTNTRDIRDFGVQGKCSGFTFSFAVFNYKETLVSFGGQKASKTDKLHDVVQDFFTRDRVRSMDRIISGFYG